MVAMPYYLWMLFVSSLYVRVVSTVINRHTEIFELNAVEGWRVGYNNNR